MLNKSLIFNYLTLILAILTICTSVWSIVKNTNPIICIILMCLMLISSYISRKINNKETMLTNEQKDVLKQVKDKSEEK